MSGAFRGFQRSNKPLSSYLDQRYTVPALDAVAAMNLDELSDPDALVQRKVGTAGSPSHRCRNQGSSARTKPHGWDRLVG